MAPAVSERRALRGSTTLRGPRREAGALIRRSTPQSSGSPWSGLYLPSRRPAASPSRSSCTTTGRRRATDRPPNRADPRSSVRHPRVRGPASHGDRYETAAPPHGRAQSDSAWPTMSKSTSSSSARTASPIVPGGPPQQAITATRSAELGSRIAAGDLAGKGPTLAMCRIPDAAARRKPFRFHQLPPRTDGGRGASCPSARSSRVLECAGKVSSRENAVARPRDAAPTSTLLRVRHQRPSECVNPVRRLRLTPARWSAHRTLRCRSGSEIGQVRRRALV